MALISAILKARPIILNKASSSITTSKSSKLSETTECRKCGAIIEKVDPCEGECPPIPCKVPEAEPPPPEPCEKYDGQNLMSQCPQPKAPGGGPPVVCRKNNWPFIGFSLVFFVTTIYTCVTCMNDRVCVP